MKRLLRLLPLPLAVLALGACNLDTAEKTGSNKPAPSASPAPAPAPAPVADDDHDDGPISQTFLWKPVSDNFGKLVVLLPASFANVSRITVSGARTESSSRSAIGNGGRPHYRFSLPGASYGKNIRVTGGGRSWVVPDGSKRTSL